MEALQKLQDRWKIHRVHFKDFNLDNVVKNKAMVLNKLNQSIMVTFYHVMKIKEELFILHDSLEHQFKENNIHMTISHLKTGQPLLHFTKTPKQTIPDIEKLAQDCIQTAIATFSERYAMERIRSAQPINFKYNVYGY